MCDGGGDIHIYICVYSRRWSIESSEGQKVAVVLAGLLWCALVGVESRVGSRVGQVEREQLSAACDVFASCRGEPAAGAEVLTGCLPGEGYLATVCGQHTYETLEI